MGFGGISIWSLILILSIFLILIISISVFRLTVKKSRLSSMAGISHKSKMSNDESLYLDATTEFESNDRDPALWAKCMSVCEGDEQKAKYKYINKRVKSLSQNNKEQVSQEAESLREGKGFIVNLSSGNYSLAQTYWLYGVVGGVVLGIPFSFITSNFITSIGTGWIFTYLFSIVIYQITVLFGVWRSSDKYSGPKIWAILAKLAVILNWLMLFTTWFIFTYIIV